jgi:uncharacterized repeat protein (TIGR01451 family)
MGHGSIKTWARWGDQHILESSDFAGLNNGPLAPFLVTGNCSNGLFAHPLTLESLAESFVGIEGKGGVGAWSPTGLGYAYWHDELLNALFQAMFRNHLHQMGPATAAAKIEAFGALGWSEPVEIFTLFGDPALALKIVQPRLTLKKTGSASHVQPGRALTYTLTYTNEGEHPAEGVVLTEEYAPGTTFESASPAPTSGEDVWGLGVLPPGATGTITVTVHVSEALPLDTALLNTARLSGLGLEAEIATASTIVSRPDLRLIKTAAAPSVPRGQLLTYTLTYSNPSPLLASGVALTETYDPYTLYQAADPPPTHGDDVWQIGTLAPGASGTITVSVRVRESVPGGTTLLNTVRLGGDDLDVKTATARTPVWHFFFFPLILAQ